MRKKSDQEKKKQKKRQLPGKKGMTLGAGALVLLCLGGGLGLGLGGMGGGPEAAPGTETAPAATTEAPTVTAETTPPRRETLSVSVVEGGYIYENRPIELPELLEVLAEKPDCLVEITDENASLQAYQALQEGLRERGILYVENFSR